ncbi:hypothetical protein [Halorubellus sp. PRR65]|uniref:hypothetical protein n=1 Tax=Halorubellus sp. PRR65 TaxID=3098148 RepID=UPI002B25CA2E|nr:hypothetical protein [Halorubellus sp. PRR65]
MNSLQGVVLGVGMVVGGVLVYRYAEGLAGVRTRNAPAGVPGAPDDGPVMKVALNRAFALGTVLLGLATVLYSLV